MSVTRDRIKIEKLEKKVALCTQYLIVHAAETGEMGAYDLLEKIEGKRSSYEVLMARAQPFLDAKQKARDVAIAKANEKYLKESKIEL